MMRLFGYTPNARSRQTDEDETFARRQENLRKLEEQREAVRTELSKALQEIIQDKTTYD